MEVVWPVRVVEIDKVEVGSGIKKMGTEVVGRVFSLRGGREDVEHRLDLSLCF